MADLTTLLSKFLQSLELYSGRVSGTLTSDMTSRTTSGTSAEEAWTYSLPANTLNANHRAIRVRAWGSTAATANAKRAELAFGGTTVSLVGGGSVAANNVGWHIDAVIGRITATTQTASAVSTYANQNANWVETTAPGETLTGAVTLKITLTTATIAGDMTLKGVIVELLN